MAKCDEGYLCSVCGEDVERMVQSDLYLRYVIGLLDPELLHVLPDRHIRCNPELAQFIVADDFSPVVVEGVFSKSNLDAEFVRVREDLVTRGYRRLQEIKRGGDLAILEYPLPEVIARMKEKERKEPGG